MMKFLTNGNALLCLHQGEKLRIEPWGRDSLRVRSTMLPEFSGKEWALTETPEQTEAVISIEEQATITNGRIKATVNHAGVISFYKDGVFPGLRRHHLPGEPLPENLQPGVEGRHRRQRVFPERQI